MNDLFKSLNNNSVPTNNMQGLINQFNQFRQNFKGDPRQQIQQMLNSGRITQEQYNQAVQKANALRNMLGMK